MSDFAIPADIHRSGVAMVATSMDRDDNCNVTFYKRPVLHGFESEQARRPVYYNANYVRIIRPGERDVVDREATEVDAMRWPRQWQAFQNEQAQVPDGTPIEVMYPQDPALCLEMKRLAIHTVEQLANLGEPGIQRLGMGARDRVHQAKAFLEAAKGAMGAGKLQGELDAAHDRIASLENMIEQLKAEMAEQRKGNRK